MVKSTHWDAGRSTSLDVEGNYAFVGTISIFLGGGVDVFDICDPARQLRIGRYENSVPTEKVEVVGNRVYLAAEKRLEILEVTFGYNRPRPLSVRQNETHLEVSWAVGLARTKLQRTSALRPDAAWKDFIHWTGS